MAFEPPNGWSYDPETGLLAAPEGTTEIPYRFCVNKGITKLIIPEGITSIADSAFYNNPIESLTLPSSLEYVGNKAFTSMLLRELRIPAGTDMAGNAIINPNKNNDRVDVILEGKDHHTFTTTSEGWGQWITSCNIDLYYPGTRSEYLKLMVNDNIPTSILDVNSDIILHCTDDADYDTWKDKFNDGGGEDPMPDTNNSEMICVSEEMLELLVTQILTKVNTRIASRIVNTISEESDANHVPSALAVFNFLRTFSPNMKYETVTGSIDTVTEPAANTIYLQRDDEADTTWAMYLSVDGEWIMIGDTTVDLTNYWSKTAADIEALRDQILDEMGLTLIKEGIDYDNLFKDNTATQQIILGWLDSGTIVRTTEEGLAALYVELDKRYVQVANLKVVTAEQIQTAVDAAFAATEPEI